MNFSQGVTLLFMLCTFTSSGLAQSFDLKEYSWKNRLLIVFAEQENVQAYQSLIKTLETLNDEFTDRDMVMISLFEEGTSMAGDSPITSDDVLRLRKQFDVASGDFKVFLIGKDGGIKKQGGKEIRIEHLFSLIDTMPMRRSEMRRKSNDP